MGQTKFLPKEILMREVGFAGRHNKTVQWHTVQITVKPFLSMDEYMKTVRDIIGDCTSQEGEVAVELIDFATRLRIITAYAGIEMPENIDEMYRVVYCSDLYDTILKNVCRPQADAIVDAVRHIVGCGVR